MAQGRLGEAVALLDEAVAADPRDAEAWHALGVALVRRGEALRGLEALRRAALLAPGLAGARRDLAIALDRGGRGAEAAGHYRAFLEQASADAPGRADVGRRLGELAAAGAGR
jgi:Flp pilus assembly protein TadD